MSRKKTEEFIIKYIDKITKSKKNVDLYKDMFKSMSNKEFDEFIDKLDSGEIMLNVIVPHDEDVTDISVENNIKIGKELGYDFFQYNFIGPTDTEPRIRTKYKLLNMLLPFRRAKQTIEKGISVSENDKKIDQLTGQVTGDSRSSKLSYPELQLLVGMGLKDTVVEFIRDRGGDSEAMRVTKQALLKYGKVSKSLIEMYKSGVVSSQVLKAYFNGMHLKINL